MIIVAIKVIATTVFLLFSLKVFIIMKDCTNMGANNNNGYHSNIKNVPSITTHNNFNNRISTTTVAIKIVSIINSKRRILLMVIVLVLYHKKFENQQKIALFKNTTLELGVSIRNQKKNRP
jgi:hypothetical protein